MKCTCGEVATLRIRSTWLGARGFDVEEVLCKACWQRVLEGIGQAEREGLLSHWWSYRVENL